MEERTDTVVAEANSLEEANKYRSRMLDSDPRLWLFVCKNESSGTYEVSAATNWCGRLSKNRIQELIGMYNEVNQELWIEWNARHGEPTDVNDLVTSAPEIPELESHTSASAAQLQPSD